MSRILFDAFESTAVVVAGAADMTAELDAAAQASLGIAATIGAAVADELTAAAAMTSAPPPVAASVAADLTSELGAAANAMSSIYFIPPAPGDPRVAVVTH